MIRIGELLPKIKTIILCLICGLFLSFPSLSWAWLGKVVGVAGGDTIIVLRDKKQIKIRLYGIDCPEKVQAFGNMKSSTIYC